MKLRSLVRLFGPSTALFSPFLCICGRQGRHCGHFETSATAYKSIASISKFREGDSPPRSHSSDVNDGRSSRRVKPLDRFGPPVGAVRIEQANVSPLFPLHPRHERQGDELKWERTNRER